VTGAVSAPGGGSTDIDWEEPRRPDTRDGAPVLSAEGFEGPLDWLLEMARAHKIDLARLPIAALIQSFVNALDAALARRGGRAPVLQHWADWLVMAATLTQLRSRLLLPAEASEAKTALGEAEALRRQLVGREAMRAAADWLERRPQLGREVFPRGYPEAPGSSRGADIADLLRACLSLLRVPAQLAAAYEPRPPPFWRVSQAIARIETMLAERPAGAPLSAFLPAVAAEHADRDTRCRAAVASTLVAGLELARGGALRLGQQEPWAAILVTAREP
jgi:segregation and condensation protein A